MLNFSFGPNIFLGIILSLGILTLYFIRDIKPEIARDEDIFFATICLLYSCILIIHGWRLDPILLFSQVLIIVTVLVAGWENIRLRGLVKNMSKLKKKNSKLLSWFQICK
jgi:Mn2+/Fe2+ NRAMP family transporter